MSEASFLPSGLKLWENIKSLRKMTNAMGINSQWLLPIGATPYREIYKQGSMKLYRYSIPGVEKTMSKPLLIVPSLINRAFVLDLLPGKSLVEFYVQQGFDVYMIDWGAPKAEDRWLSFEQFVRGRFRNFVKFVKALHKTDSIHVLGQCLGGTVSAIYASLYPEDFRTLSLMTTPMDFKDSGKLGLWSTNPVFDLDLFVEAYGNAPWALMSATFMMIKPTMNTSKFHKLMGKLKDENFIRNFIAHEVWTWDNQDFPGECYKTLIRDFYNGNCIVKNELYVGPEIVDLSNIECPVFDIAARDDHVVSCGSTFKKEYLKDDAVFQSVEMAGGHIGAVLGSKAQYEIWPKLAAWARKYDTDAA